MSTVTSKGSHKRAKREPVDPNAPVVEVNETASIAALLKMVSSYVRARRPFKEFGFNWPIVSWIGMVALSLFQSPTKILCMKLVDTPKPVCNNRRLRYKTAKLLPSGSAPSGLGCGRRAQD